MANIARHCWNGWDGRGIEDGHQRSSQARGDRTRGRRGNAGGIGEGEVQELGGDVELHESGHVGRAERDVHEDGELNTMKLEKVEEGVQILEGREEGDVGDAGVATRRVDRGCARGFGLENRVRKEVDEQRHECSTCAEHGGSRIPEGLGMQSMITDLLLSVRVGVWTDSNAAKAIASRRGLGKTRHSEMFTATGGDHIRKIEDCAGIRKSTFGGPFDGGKVVVRN